MKIIDLEQRSSDWKKFRAAKVSGTRLSIVMGGAKAQETLLYELLAETISPVEEIYTTEAMQRGIDLEPTGLYKVSQLLEKDLTEVGLIEKDEFTILSPDAIIYNKDGIITEAVELKCLAAKKQVRYMMMDSFKDVYSYEKSYYRQVVHYFVVIPTLEKLYFTLYNPDIWKKDMQLYVMEVTREELEADIKKAGERLQEFKLTFLELKKKLGKKK